MDRLNLLDLAKAFKWQTYEHKKFAVILTRENVTLWITLQFAERSDRTYMLDFVHSPSSDIRSFLE